MMRLREERMIPCGIQRASVGAEGILSLNGPIAGGMFTEGRVPRLERGNLSTVM